MSQGSYQDRIQHARRLLEASHFAVAFTGAGISTPSGIPDFRSQSTGLWQRFDPMEVASLSAFRFHPEKFYAWLRPLAAQSLQAQPNPAHIALAHLETSGILKALITQNIDNLHQRAGSQRVLPVHGTLNQMGCAHCKKQYPSSQFTTQLTDPAAPLPLCPSCGSLLKPAIVLYEEALPEDTWLAAETACRQADLMLVCGSSLEVYPAAWLPQMALKNKASLIIINLSPTPLDAQADVLLPFDVVEALPALAAR